jgi:Asp-tRNA(Asn)/Glu-tRNA(Gln) amidotransferase C subunit
MEIDTTEMVRYVVKLLKISLTEDRVREVTPALLQILKLIQPLSHLDLPKEIETTTYFVHISERV